MTESKERLVAIDWLRGLVMMVMAVDHASVVFNAGRTALDSPYPIAAFFEPAWTPGTALPAAQFFTRWITHLCAPTFLFLSGTSLALSTASRSARGIPPPAIDRHLVARGLVLIALDALWIALLPSLATGHYVLALQVLFAIGTSLCAMALLRHLPSPLLVLLALGWLAGGEFITLALAPVGESARGASALLLAPGRAGPAGIAYPMLGWLAMMMLGWAFGSHLLALRRRGLPASTAAPRCAAAGVAGLALFVVVRGANGYGNMALLRDDASLIQWLHVCKYPASLAFTALELGLMALLLAGMLALQARLSAAPRARNPFLVLGKTALFFYLLHFLLLGTASTALGLTSRGGLTHTWIAAAGVVAAMYPLCLWYGRYKARHPDGFAQYI
ncbi:MAG TPA: heparan-alpha-glucosaminide N-acetyltransferase domain-containing protein [Myxococcota bacterium]|nr:heparan-alpha-glucosaminide N-acetyltransferase domain-containing protein [Myxococcota bacterium]